MIGSWPLHAPSGAKALYMGFLEHCLACILSTFWGFDKIPDLAFSPELTGKKSSYSDQYCLSYLCT